VSHDFYKGKKQNRNAKRRLAQIAALPEVVDSDIYELLFGVEDEISRAKDNDEILSRFTDERITVPVLQSFLANDELGQKLREAYGSGGGLPQFANNRDLEALELFEIKTTNQLRREILKADKWIKVFFKVYIRNFIYQHSAQGRSQDCMSSFIHTPTSLFIVAAMVAQFDHKTLVSKTSKLGWCDHSVFDAAWMAGVDRS